jgi:hypothetical protein
MTRKIYRTAQGKQVDLGALQLQNENVRAVGNMNVNARGDLLDSWNRPIDKKTTSVLKNYDRQISNVTDTPVTKNPSPTNPAVPSSAATKPKDPTKTTKTSKPDNPETSAKSPLVDNPSEGGLAAAMAKARVIRENPIMSHRDMVKKRPGVEKI